MVLKLYGYPKCSTCRQAEGYLKRKERAYEAVDITATPGLGELEALLARLGGDVRRLFNTSGQVYRELNVKATLPGMSTEAALRLLAGNGKLIRRPVLVVDGAPVAAGFDATEWDRWL